MCGWMCVFVCSICVCMCTFGVKDRMPKSTFIQQILITPPL